MFTNKKFCEKRVIFFAVLCFLMSALETAIPKPLPFFRIGLANLPLILALPVMGRREYFFLALLKVLSQGLVSGTIFSYVFIFSVSGTFASSFVMYFLHSVCSRKIISFVGISLMGALFNNGAQIILAWFLLFGSGIRYAIPFMLLVTLVCSAALGIFACVFEKKSLWYKEILESTDYGEINYYSMVNSLCSVGLDLCWQLEEIGIKFDEISDFNLFRMIISKLYTKDQTRILFGDKIDFSQMKSYTDKDGKIFMMQAELVNVPLKNQPKIAGEHICNIAANEPIEIIEAGQIYSKVRYKNNVGYILSCHISKKDGRFIIADSTEQQALNDGVYSLKYIDKILVDWVTRGYKSVSDIEKNKEMVKEIDDNTPDIVDWDWLDDEEEYDYIIDNSGSYDELFKTIWDIVHNDVVFKNNAPSCSYV